jgi:hypothetical protein
MNAGIIVVNYFHSVDCDDEESTCNADPKRTEDGESSV